MVDTPVDSLVHDCFLEFVDTVDLLQGVPQVGHLLIREQVFRYRKYGRMIGDFVQSLDGFLVVVGTYAIEFG
jgi:hypothetical protein